jgi:hypothetical protein
VPRSASFTATSPAARVNRPVFHRQNPSSHYPRNSIHLNEIGLVQSYAQTPIIKDRGNFMLSGHPTVLPTSASQLQQTVVKKRHPNASPNLTPIPTRLCPQKSTPGGCGGMANLSRHEHSSQRPATPLLLTILAVTPLEEIPWRYPHPPSLTFQTTSPQDPTQGGGGALNRPPTSFVSSTSPKTRATMPAGEIQ